ncbi:MAG: hypothetical protein ACREFU_00400, partial [Acetobacteraceae bacterium]
VVPWWSFTKTVLAATALALVRDHALALDQPIDEAPCALHPAPTASAHGRPRRLERVQVE